MWSVCLTLFLNACQASLSISAPTQDGSTGARMDVTFRELYASLGGEAVLGPIISNELVGPDGQVHQYTANALLVYDPAQEIRWRWRLSLLSLELGIGMPASEQDARGSGSAFEIDPGFKEYYQTHSQNMFGAPITGLRYNALLRRYEQYFESIALYRMQGDSTGQVGLLALGAWKCGDECTYSPEPSAQVLIEPVVQQPFQPALHGWGVALTGFPLTPAYPIANGLYEQVYENVVINGDPSRPGSLEWVALPAAAGVFQDPPTQRFTQAGFTFIEIEPGRGYQVPDYFIDFLEDNNGLDVAGKPRTRPGSTTYMIMRQCFETLCLLYDGRQVFAETLGYYFSAVRTPERILPASPAHSVTQMTLRTWPGYPMLSSQQKQVIWVEARLDGEPLQDQRVELRLQRPGSDVTESYPLPPTGMDGRTSYPLGSIRAANATLITYQVCSSWGEAGEVCTTADYVIWNP